MNKLTYSAEFQKRKRIKERKKKHVYNFSGQRAILEIVLIN